MSLLTMAKQNSHSGVSTASPFDTPGRTGTTMGRFGDYSSSTSSVDPDLFFDTPNRANQHQPSHDSLIDSFTLFDPSINSTESSPSSATSRVSSTVDPASLYNPIVFNQQFSQFQRATSRGKYHLPPSYGQSMEITETEEDDEGEEDILENPAGRLYVQRTVDDVGDDDEEEGKPLSGNGSHPSGRYENYMLDYDDYEQYYDPNVQYPTAGHGRSKSAHNQHYIVEEEEEEEGVEEEMAYYSGNGTAMGDNEVSLDMVADAKTYGLMLPPYHHFRSGQGPPGGQQAQPQFNMLQHPYMYGNPFSYGLHTIIEESENESSLQTLSSITSSNFASLQFDPNGASSLTPTNTSRRLAANPIHTQQMGELSDPSLSPSESESSPSLKEKFRSRKPIKSRSTSHPHQPRPLESRPQRSSGENFSEISFTSSSTFSENGSEPDEESDEEPVAFQVVNANSALTAQLRESTLHQTDVTELADSTTSRLERYFTSSLLVANQSKSQPKMSQSPSTTPSPPPKPFLPTIKVTPADDSPTTTQLLSPLKPKLRHPRTVFQSLPQTVKFYLLQSSVRQLLTNPQFRRLSLAQLHRLNSQFLRFDWISLLRSVLQANVYAQFPLLGPKVNRVFRSIFSISQLRQHAANYLIDHLLDTSAIHFIRDHQLAAIHLRRKSRHENSKLTKNVNSEIKSKRKGKFGKSQIQITINAGQSTIIIQNDAHNRAPGKAEMPTIPHRSRREVKLCAIKEKRPAPQPPTAGGALSDATDAHKMMYRTVLHVNDVNGHNYPSPSRPAADEYPEAEERMGHANKARIAQMLHTSNPLNRNFLVKSILSDSSDSEELSKQNSEIYGWIQRMPDSELYTVQSDESERSKGKSGKYSNSSSNLLLGSLRSRSKDRANGSDFDSNSNAAKFKTISNSHSKLTATRSEAHSETSQQRLDRSQKVSKSFRDNRSSASTLPHLPNGDVQSTQSTWDSIYGSGIKLLKNISFVRNRSRSSSKDRDSTVNRASEEAEESGEDGYGSTRNKSISEPNLHKANRNRSRASKVSGAKEETLEVSSIYTTIQPPPTSNGNSKSTPHLTGSHQNGRHSQVHQEGNQHQQQEEEESVTTSAMSTPSLLYRLSNPVTTAGNSLTMRSISTSSLRTTKRSSSSERSHHHQQSSPYGQTTQLTVNGEWQKMTPTETKKQKDTDSPNWVRKPSSLRLSSTEAHSTTLLSSTLTKNIPSSQQYHRTEIVTDTHLTVPEKTIDPVPTTTTTTLITTISESSSKVPIGELSLAVSYEMRIGALEISIHKVRIDAPKQKADFYVKVYLLPDRSKSSKRKTRVVKAFRSITGRTPAGQLTAEFNETLRFTGPFNEFTGKRLWLSIWNNDKFGRNEPAAEMVLGPLDSPLLSSGQLGTITWYRLLEPMSTNPKPIPAIKESTFTQSNGNPTQGSTNYEEPPKLTTVSVSTLEPQFAGTIFLAVKFQTESGTPSALDYQQFSTEGSLHILLKEAQNLQFKMGSPNIIGSTYCKISLQPERSKTDRERSSLIKAPLEYSSNPRWNQQFAFHNLTSAELQGRTLVITVWFQAEHAMQKNGKKIIVGGVSLSGDTLDSTPNEVNLWNQLLDRHNMWAYGEFPLRKLKDVK